MHSVYREQAKTLLLRGADHAIADEEGRSPKGLATQRGRRAALAVIEVRPCSLDE